MNIYSNLKWIFAAIILSLFCRVFLISVYRIPTNSMSPNLIDGDIVIANQLAYGLKFPWMKAGYFESEPQVGDVVIFRVKSNVSEEYQVWRIKEKMTENKYLVRIDNPTEGGISAQIVHRDQILSKAWVVALSVGTTQDSISAEKSVRWNRFLTIVK